MSYSIDLSTHGRELKQAYDAIVSSDPDTTWAVFNYGAGQSNALSLRAKGSGDLDEFVEEFDDGKVQYGFTRVDYNNLPKYVLVGWVGEGVPEQTKGYFNAHYSAVSKYFHGYHVQITARSADDLSPAIILDKIGKSAGSKYSTPSRHGAVPTKPTYKPAALGGASEDDWGDAEPVTESQPTKVASSYQPTKVDIHAIRSSAKDKPEPVKSSYEPVGKVDIAALRAQGKDSKFADSRPAPVSSSYQPVGKVDIAAIREQAKKANYKETIESTPIRTPVNDDTQEPVSSVKDRMKSFKDKPVDQGEEKEVEDPKSVQDRMSTFSGTGRLTEMPKPKIQNNVSSRFSPASGAGRGTAPAVPSNPYGVPGNQSKAAAGFKNFGAENGKTPAQLWAEKHAKTSGSTSPAVSTTPSANEPEPPREPSPEPEEEEHTSIADLRNKFSGAGLEKSEPPKKHEESVVDHSSSSFNDITSRFAKQATPTPPPAPPAPAHEEREPSPERVSVPLANPVARHAPPAPEPEPQQPEVEPSRSVPPAPQPTEQNSAVAAAQQAVAAAVGNQAPSGGGSGPKAVAEYDYEVAEEGEIGFKEGELITSIEFLDTDWWQGTNSKGETGLFPANFVELQEDSQATEPAPAPAAPVAAEPVQHAEPIQHAESAPAQPEPETASAVAAYDYDVGEEGEIGFTEGEIITNIEFLDPDWWQGTNSKGESGLFPANHVELR